MRHCLRRRAFSCQSRLLLSSLSCLLASICGSAQAFVVISSSPTENMSCSAGVCSPTAKDAVLNAGDLDNMLASGSINVTTKGSGVQAKDIDVKAGISWSTASALTLDAYESLTIDQPVSVQSLASLTLTTNDGGKNGLLSFGTHGNVTFANLSSALVINGTAYALENSIKSLASAIAADPSGAFALANSYDASKDGTYTSVPIPTFLTGTLEGLGNKISNLAIDDAADNEVGLFAETEAGSALRNLAFLRIAVASSLPKAVVGSFAGVIRGDATRVFAAGIVSGQDTAGGLAGGSAGSITLSRASVDVSGTASGGLVGVNAGALSESFATGKASGSVSAGGLVGENEATVVNCYALGASIGSTGVYVGGFAGENIIGGLGGGISSSYSTGKVKSTDKATKGGFVGYDGTEGTIDNSYWDLDTSRIHDPRRGAGNRRNDLGITGLTTPQLQSGLPPGFDSSIWRQRTDINNGFPYLMANPPSK